MRTRTIKKQVWLNREESVTLKKKAKKAGINESDLIRRLIMDSIIKEKPDEIFFSTLYELRAIGNNLNQIAKRLNYDGTFYNEMYTEEVKKLNDFILQMKSTLLI